MRHHMDIRIQRSETGALRALLEHEGESVVVAVLGPPLATAPGAQDAFAEMLKECSAAWVKALGGTHVGFTGRGAAEDN